MKPFKHIAVLMGGVSNERDVSLASGRAVAVGLREAGYRVTEVTLDAPRVRLPDGVDAAFIALHGTYGEDGGVQAELDRQAVPYTGSGAAASRLAFDKVLSKQCFDAHGLPTAPWQVLAATEQAPPFAPPLVIKPPREGSSVGLQWVFAADEWSAALARARRVATELLVERYLPGREWTVGILEGETLPVIQIEAPQDRYDLEAKYHSNATRYRVVMPEETPLARTCAGLARRVWDVLGARGMARVDFRVSPEGQCAVLELNTIPGFTRTSLLPKAAAAAGIDFPTLCDRIVRHARCDAVEATETCDAP